VKDWKSVKIRVALVSGYLPPGMSNLGLAILCDLLNHGNVVGQTFLLAPDEISCSRFDIFAETKSLSAFDIIGFSYLTNL
jgi:hypothetical protein